MAWTVRIIQALGDHDNHDEDFVQGTSVTRTSEDYADSPLGELSAKEIADRIRDENTLIHDVEAPGCWVKVTDADGTVVYDDFREVY